MYKFKLLILLFTLLLVSNSYSSTIIKIRFDDAQGLKIGSDVKKEGIQIGTVTGYEIEGTSVIIDIEIDKEIKIPIDSRFSRTQDGLLGSKFIDIIPGNNTNVFIKSYEKQGIVDSNQPEVSSLTNDLSDFARKLNELLTQDVKNDITEIKTTSDQFKIFIEENKDILTQEEKDNFKMILSNLNELCLIGYWIYDKDLFYNEMKRLNIPKIDMSVYFNRVEMEFNSDSTFVSYLDDQVTYGYWDINDSLGMKPSNNIWKYYNYQLTDTSLYIYDGDYILTFKRQKETNND